MSRFQALRNSSPNAPAVAAAPDRVEKVEEIRRSPAKAREGKKPIMGYFTPQVRRAMHQLALDEETSIQALIGEAIDMLMRDRGKPPFGER